MANPDFNTWNAVGSSPYLFTSVWGLYCRSREADILFSSKGTNLMKSRLICKIVFQLYEKTGYRNDLTMKTQAARFTFNSSLEQVFTKIKQA
jgi:hypothetical protein